METVFLNWDRPLIATVTERLLKLSKGGFVDLSNVLVIVPTVQSGRRLRESLALISEGLFPPEIVTPDTFLMRALKDEAIASEMSMVAAWISVLKAVDFDQFKTLFPIQSERTEAWQNSMARRFVQLRNELGEEGLFFQSVAQLTQKTSVDAQRWQELALLEKLYLEQLKSKGLKDPKQIRHRVAKDYRLPNHIDQIILAATPDPQPIVLQALKKANEQANVEVWIYGAESAQFDQWGRPDEKYWSERELDFENWGTYIESFESLKSMAAFIVESMRGKLTESILLGVSDPTLNPSIENALADAKIPHYNPEGSTLKNSAVGRLTELICDFCSDPGIEIIRTLLQHPDIQIWLGISPQADLVLGQLDRLFEEHLAINLTAAISFASQSKSTANLARVLTKIGQLADELNKGNFAHSLTEKLQEIYAGKIIEAATETEISWKESAEAVSARIKDIFETNELFPSLTKNFPPIALKHYLKHSHVYPTRPENAHDLLGWLELLWNDAPHLILAGLNEHSIPKSIFGDSFLPESLREELGLRTNAQRFARDAYILEALCHRRSRGKGRIDILIPKTSQDKNPLKPSRLLFQCDNNKFLNRVRKLFKETDNNFGINLQTNAWKLKPPKNLDLPTTLPVSALNSYLQCPFRFFLRYILNMRRVDVETHELSPAAFGTLFHETVAQLKGSTFDHTLKPSDLKSKLRYIAKRLFERKYGKRFSFALRLQYEALIERITFFIEHQYSDIIENGSTHILNTEEAFEISLEGFVVKGRIDRIDQRNDYLELIDYKTGNLPSHPKNAHIVPLREKVVPDHLPPETIFEKDGKSYRWINLQLPLYWLAKKTSGEKNIKTAYFNIGQTLEKSGISHWETFTEELSDSAKICATTVIKQIKSGVFWPPNLTLYEAYDEFVHLFPEGVENSIDADAFANYQFKH